MKFVPLYSLFPILVLLPFIFIDQSGLIKKKNTWPITQKMRDVTTNKRLGANLESALLYNDYACCTQYFVSTRDISKCWYDIKKYI